MKARIAALVMSLSLFTSSTAALAQRGGTPPGGGVPHDAGGAPARAPSAPAQHAPTTGFNFNRDINASQQPSNTNQRQNNVYRPPVTPPVYRPPVTPPVNRQPVTPPVNRQPVNPNANRVPVNPYHGPVAQNRPPRGSPIENPAFRGRPAWNWNRGVTWAPAPIYWGGGFWGPYALGAASAVLGGILFGTFDDPATNQVYPSYVVGPLTPGAILLSNYGLTQTPCGQPDLVVIFGPDNSVICAYPNDAVAPGEYDTDPSTLTLVSQ